MAEAKYKISPDEEKQASSGGGDESGGFESDKEKIDSMLAATQKPANVLDPFSPRMQKWDKLMFSFLIFTAIITPFEVGFCTTKYDPWFVINRLVDLGFVCDIFVNFKLAYFDGTEDMWVYEAEKIRVRLEAPRARALILTRRVPLPPSHPPPLAAGEASRARALLLTRRVPLPPSHPPPPGARARARSGTTCEAGSRSTSSRSSRSNSSP